MSANMTKLEAINEMLEAIGEYPVSALDTGGDTIEAMAENTLDRYDQRIQANGWHENTETKVELNFITHIYSVTSLVGTFLAGEPVTQASSGGTFRCHGFNSAGKLTISDITGTLGSTEVVGGWSGATCDLSGLVINGQTSGEIYLDYNTLQADSSGADFNKNVCVRDGKLYDLDNNTATFDEAITLTIIRQLDFASLTLKLQELIVAKASQVFQRRQVGGRTQDAYLSEEGVEAFRTARKSDTKNRNTNILNTSHVKRGTGQSMVRSMR